jgi:hypothetical protein
MLGLHRVLAQPLPVPRANVNLHGNRDYLVGKLAILMLDNL